MPIWVFFYFDVRSYGKESDSNIYKENYFRKKLYSNALNIPDSKLSPSSQGSQATNLCFC